MNEEMNEIKKNVWCGGYNNATLQFALSHQQQQQLQFQYVSH